MLLFLQLKRLYFQFAEHGQHPLFPVSFKGNFKSHFVAVRFVFRVKLFLSFLFCEFPAKNPA
jgi:hypothetical protein